MAHKLKLTDFVDMSDLHNKTSMPEFCLNLLGSDLKAWLKKLLEQHGVFQEAIIEGDVHDKAIIEGPVYIAKGAKVEALAYIQGPCYIGPNSEIRHSSYIRGNVYVGSNCVVGHSTEAKGSCFLDGAKAGHFAYVGESILGRQVNLGAGTKLANLKLKADEVSYKEPFSKKIIKSGLRKFGSIIGDQAQTGCNSVLSPGSLLLPKTLVYPCVHFHGTLESGSAKK